MKSILINISYIYLLQISFKSCLFCIIRHRSDLPSSSCLYTFICSFISSYYVFPSSSPHLCVTRAFIHSFIHSSIHSFIQGPPPWSGCSVIDHISLPPVFESRRGHILRVFHLWLRLITFVGRSAHLAYHVYKVAVNRHNRLFNQYFYSCITTNNRRFVLGSEIILRNIHQID